MEANMYNIANNMICFLVPVVVEVTYIIMDT